MNPQPEKHQSHQNSLLMYDLIKKDKKDIKDAELIMAFMLKRLADKLPPLTIKEISVALNIPYDSLKPRSFELRQKGSLKEVGKKGKAMLLEAVIIPVPLPVAFKFSKENVAELLKRQTGKSITACNIIVNEFINNYQK